ncbi:MAG: hypothetical protein JKY42_12345 [Flavobacteriales bacterium]|nr:hypothetical protein [Flavobacteriales bacterium]
MEKAKFVLKVLVIPFLLWGCAASEKTTETPPEPPPVIIDGEIALKVNEVVIVESFNDHHTSRNFNIEYSLIHDDILEIHVTYSGGCAQHEFILYSTKQYQKSLPPKLPVFLVHDTGGDACRELKKETLLFDVKNLKYEGQKAIQLILNTEYTVDYTY